MIFPSSNQRSRNAVAILILFLLTIPLASCENPRRMVIGRWVQHIEGSDEGAVIEFFRDGTITIDNSGTVAASQYRFTDDDIIRADMTGVWALAGPLLFKIESLDEDTLIISLLNYEDAGTVTYQRDE